MFSIEKNAEGSKLQLMPAGRIDSTTAPEFSAAVIENIDGVDDLVIDMEKLDYISSAGLRVLLSAQKKMNVQGKMMLKNVSPDIKDVLDATGMTDILSYE